MSIKFRQDFRDEPAYFDTHCHLTLCENHIPLDKHINSCRQNHIKAVLDAGVHPDDYSLRRRKLTPYPEVLMGAALAPHSVNQSSEKDLYKLEKLIQQEKVQAVSETGLEYFHFKNNRKKQQNFFYNQLLLARKYKLPVFLHIRDAYPQAAAMVKAAGIRRGAVHCFTGSKEDAASFLDLGFYLSFSGIITFKKSEKLRACLKQLPADRILTETDAPYLSPEPKRGEKNIAANIIHTNRFIAGLLQTDLNDLNRRLMQNAKKLLSL
ncbi:MAG TPA: TatD family hydrolase [Spirochaetota bacterium]|nr:TatD family hydrolase [Spirochaetota bacterium]